MLIYMKEQVELAQKMSDELYPMWLLVCLCLT
jgi:hypothetical protein